MAVTLNKLYFSEWCFKVTKVGESNEEMEAEINKVDRTQRGRSIEEVIQQDPEEIKE